MACPPHLWNSTIGTPSKVVECDWCVICADVRPGYIDPRKRKWTEDEDPR